jgi:glucosyl-dolichyl phosphate glucuronosyltransferase
MKASIIVPSCGRRTTLENTIRSLLAQDPSAAGVEIVVVDNNVDDAVSRDLHAYCASVAGSLSYVRERSPGLGAARHCGVRKASGHILIFVDDDIETSPGWLAAVIDAFQDQGVGIVGGPSIPRFIGSVPAWLWDFLIATPYGGWACGWLSLIDLGGSVDDVDPDWIWGLNFAIRRELFLRLGGMHPDYVPPGLQRWQGDGETGLTRKAKGSGVRARYVQEALVYHIIGQDRLTPAYFARRAYYQGVCDSFTSIRSGVEPSSTRLGPQSIPPRTADTSGWVAIAYDIRAATVGAYNSGFAFHQQEAEQDPALLRWIRRADFLDADIREQVKNRELASL